MQNKDKDRKHKRKTQGYGVDSDTDSDDETAVGSRKGSAVSGNALRKIIKNQRNSQGASAIARQTSGINKSKSEMQQARKKMVQKSQGHHEKFSGDVYKSNKGKGDVIKAGKLEPFSYIQLNPGLLNKRKKQQAVNSFSKVVTFGKKQDKRSSSLGGLKISHKK